MKLLTFKNDLTKSSSAMISTDIMGSANLNRKSMLTINSKNEEIEQVLFISLFNRNIIPNRPK